MVTSRSSSVVSAAFEIQAQAEHSVAELRLQGFPNEDIGIAVRQDESRKNDQIAENAGRRAEEGLAVGAVVGGALGTAASLLIPGVGLVMAWGILVVALEGASLGAAAGGLIGGLTGLGLTEEEARHYDREVEAGHPIVVARAGTRGDEAREILRRCGGYYVETRHP